MRFIVNSYRKSLTILIFIDCSQYSISYKIYLCCFEVRILVVIIYLLMLFLKPFYSSENYKCCWSNKT